VLAGRSYWLARRCLTADEGRCWGSFAKAVCRWVMTRLLSGHASAAGAGADRAPRIPPDAGPGRCWKPRSRRSGGSQFRMTMRVMILPSRTVK
jgi:hypothetical protein